MPYFHNLRSYNFLHRVFVGWNIRSTFLNIVIFDSYILFTVISLSCLISIFFRYCYRPSVEVCLFLVRGRRKKKACGWFSTINWVRCSGREKMRLHFLFEMRGMTLKTFEKGAIFLSFMSLGYFDCLKDGGVYLQKIAINRVIQLPCVHLGAKFPWASGILPNWGLDGSLQQWICFLTLRRLNPSRSWVKESGIVEWVVVSGGEWNSAARCFFAWSDHWAVYAYFSCLQILYSKRNCLRSVKTMLGYLNSYLLVL